MPMSSSSYSSDKTLRMPCEKTSNSGKKSRGSQWYAHISERWMRRQDIHIFTDMQVIQKQSDSGGVEVGETRIWVPGSDYASTLIKDSPGNPSAPTDGGTDEKGQIKSSSRKQNDGLISSGTTASKPAVRVKMKDTRQGFSVGGMVPVYRSTWWGLAVEKEVLEEGESLPHAIFIKDREPGSLRNVIDSVDLVHQCPSAGIEAAVGTKTKWSITVVITQAAAAPTPTPRLYGIIKHHASKQLALGSSGMVPAQWQCAANMYPGSDGRGRGVWRGVPGAARRGGRCDVIMWRGEAGVAWRGEVCQVLRVAGVGVRHGRARSGRGEARVRARRLQTSDDGPVGRDWRAGVAGVAALRGGLGGDRSSSPQTMRLMVMVEDKRDGDCSSDGSRDESTARSTESIGLTVYRVYLVVYPVYRVYLVYVYLGKIRLSRGDAEQSHVTSNPTCSRPPSSRAGISMVEHSTQPFLPPELEHLIFELA
ncbi:hypothetical protein FB45DRAFT_1001549, partial [Roridomyces roridus]